MTDELTLDDLPQPIEQSRVHPDELHTDGDNPNEQTDEMFGLLCDNLRSKGWLGNAIVADSEGCIADGEHRWRAAQEIGLTEVPVKFYEIDDAERRLWRQELNKISGEHDTKRDALEYDHLLSNGKTEDVEALTDAADEDLDELLAELSVETEQSPGYEYDPEHNVYFEDCVDGMAERLDENSVDCVITDPPYGFDFTGRTDKKKKHDSIQNADDWGLFEDFLSEARRVLRPDGHIYVFWNWKHYGKIERLFRDRFVHHNTLVWVKNNFGLNDANSSYQYRPQHEWCLYGSPEADPRDMESGNSRSDVLEFDLVGGQYDHPTEKPVSLMTEFVEASTREGELICDPFMGSGTTAVAAIQNDREYVGFELDGENYRDVIERRIGEAKRQREASVNTDE
jgi:DNA modification methylase